jgi:hypothetical protein
MFIIGVIIHVNGTKLVAVSAHIPFFSEILNTDSDILWNVIKTQDRHIYRYDYELASWNTVAYYIKILRLSDFKLCFR